MHRTAVALLVASLVLVAGVGPVAGAGGTETAPASEPTPVSECRTISSVGTYVLTGNLTPSTANEPCLDIESSNVVVDGNGHAIVGPNRSTGTGVRAVRVSNVTVTDLAVREVGMGLQFRKVNDLTVRGVSVARTGTRGGTSGDVGILVNQGAGVRILDSEVHETVSHGVILDGVRDATVDGLVSTGHRFEGLNVVESRNVTVRNSRAAASDSGFELAGTDLVLRNLTARDNGDGVAVVDGRNVSVVGVTASNNSDGLAVAGRNITARNVRVAGDISLGNGREIAARGLRITGPGGRLEIDSATDVRVADVRIASGETGVYVGESTNVTVRNATVGESPNAFNAYGSTDVLLVDSTLQGRLLTGEGGQARVRDTAWGPLRVTNATVGAGILSLRETGPGGASTLGPAVTLAALNGAGNVTGRVRYPAADSPTVYTKRGSWTETPDRLVGTDGGTLVSMAATTGSDTVTVVATGGTAATATGDGGSGDGGSGGEDGSDGDDDGGDDDTGSGGGADGGSTADGGSGGGDGGGGTDTSGGSGPGLGALPALVALGVVCWLGRRSASR